MEDVGLIRVLAAFAFVIGLILLLSWVMKNLRGSRWVEKIQGERRLQMVEQLYIDNKHKLILVKCDAVEHLLLVGAQGSQVISKITGKEKSK